MTKGNVIPLKDEVKHNAAYRRELFTAKHAQVVVMTLRPGEEIGEEVHDGDQLIYAVKGDGAATVDGVQQQFEEGDMLCVPAGMRHNLWNGGDEPLRLFTVYAPPQHAPGTVQRTKSDATRAETAVVSA